MSGHDFEIDAALWAAYRRYDKAALTEKLFRRYLGRVTRVQSPESFLITKGDRTPSRLSRLGDAGPTP
jgi:hypothetical protein